MQVYAIKRYINADKLQFIFLIGGAGFQPAAAACCKLSVYSRKATISRCSKPAAAAGYKPAPQLG